MEKFFASLPKPAVAFLAIAASLIFFALYDPPNSICDVQSENLKEELKGQVFPITVNKNKIPPLLLKAQEACQLGNSAGSCYEYFSILKKLAKAIQNYSSECKSDFVSIAEVKTALKEGAILMAKMAWGSRPPEAGPGRFGWFQESELALFCRLRDVHTQSFGEDAWAELRKNVFKELPGDLPPGMTQNAAETVGVEPPKAEATLSEKEMWERSVFSARCENFR